jgi:hypothetical protein
MRKLGFAAAVAAGLAVGSLAAVHAKLPPPPAKTDADKAAEAEKAAAAKARDAEMLDKARDRAVANYKKNKGIAMDAKPPQAVAKDAAKK